MKKKIKKRAKKRNFELAIALYMMHNSEETKPNKMNTLATFDTASNNEAFFLAEKLSDAGFNVKAAARSAYIFSYTMTEKELAAAAAAALE